MIKTFDNRIWKNEYCFKCNKITETENEKLEVSKENKILKGDCKDCKYIKLLYSIKIKKKTTNKKLLF